MRTYEHHPVWVRAVWLTILVGLLMVGVVAVERSLDAMTAGVVLLAGLAVLWFEYRVLSARVTADADGVFVRNVFSTRRVAWDDIREVEFRSYGPCRLHLVTGGYVGLFALQQTSWRQSLNRPDPRLVEKVADLNRRAG